MERRRGLLSGDGTPLFDDNGLPTYPGWRLPDDVGHPAEQMIKMRDREPFDDAPPAHHALWHERMAVLWERLADRQVPLLAKEMRWLAEGHRRKATDFQQRPNTDRRGPRGSKPRIKTQPPAAEGTS